VTLGSMSMLRSAALLFNNGVPVPIEKFQFLIYLGNKKLYIAGTGLGLPVTTVILAVIALIMAAVMAGTGIGRRVYSVGSNEDASRLSGVDVFRVKVFVYCTCSLLAGLAGVLYAGYSQQGDPRSGAMFELNAISAAVIGGALLTGGRGSIVGTLLGAVLLGSIVSMINFRVGDPARWEGMVVGAVLLLAVIFNRLRQIRFFENLWARAFGRRPAAHPAG
ncbi:MAG TPA: ABC transporter permease, partial [Armatimonadota bacterium]|nr:ABC transporter permease [Armatimonadota bacterium]